MRKKYNLPPTQRRRFVYNSKCHTCGGSGSATIERSDGTTYHGVCPDCEGSGWQGGMDKGQANREGYYDRTPF